MSPPKTAQTVLSDCVRPRRPGNLFPSTKVSVIRGLRVRRSKLPLRSRHWAPQMAGRPPGRRTRKMLAIRKHRRRRDVARGMPPPAHRPPMLRRATGQRESASGGPDSRRDCKESFGL